MNASVAIGARRRFLPSAPVLATTGRGVFWGLGSRRWILWIALQLSPSSTSPVDDPVFHLRTAHAVAVANAVTLCGSSDLRSTLTWQHHSFDVLRDMFGRSRCMVPRP